MGDAYIMRNAQGGNDSIVVETLDGGAEVIGDAYWMGNSKGGDDTLRVDTQKAYTYIFGDGSRMGIDEKEINLLSGAQGGNDYIVVTNAQGVAGGNGEIYGDAWLMYGDAKGGDDIIEIKSDFNLKYVGGDAWQMGMKGSGAKGGNDRIHVTGNMISGEILGDAYWMHNNAQGGDDTIIVDGYRQWRLHYRR